MCRRGFARSGCDCDGLLGLADSIATNRLIGPRHVAVARLVDMVDTLKPWTEDDRSGRYPGVLVRPGSPLIFWQRPSRNLHLDRLSPRFSPNTRVLCLFGRSRGCR